MPAHSQHPCKSSQNNRNNTWPKKGGLCLLKHVMRKEKKDSKLKATEQGQAFKRSLLLYLPHKTVYLSYEDMLADRNALKLHL